MTGVWLQLRLKWLWLAHAYPFHFAHKPLCDRFRHDVLRVGHIAVCRSCTMAYTGLIAGGLLCWWLHPAAATWAPWWLLAAGGLTVAMSHPRWYGRWPRTVRDLLRFSMGSLIALSGYLLLAQQIAVGLAAAVVLAWFWRSYYRKRGGRKAAACGGCPELEQGRICPGYERQAVLIRQYEEKATELVYQAQTANAPADLAPPG